MRLRVSSEGKLGLSITHKLIAQVSAAGRPRQKLPMRSLSEIREFEREYSSPRRRKYTTLANAIRHPITPSRTISTVIGTTRSCQRERKLNHVIFARRLTLSLGACGLQLRKVSDSIADADKGCSPVLHASGGP